jgi:hypothetical protein
MYDKSDPRSSLAPPQTGRGNVAAYSPADYLRFYEGEPQQSNALSRTWLGRGQNAVVAYSETEAGARFDRTGQLDEWVLILPDADAGAQVSIDGTRHSILSHSITFVPPGDSEVTLQAGGRAIRLFTSRSADLANACCNASAYREPHHNIPRFQAWPTPPDGYKLRSYSLDVADEPGRFGRIWRCTTFMVNYLTPNLGPRDITKLSPHHHDDFEQYSLALRGAFTHHLRWPWTIDMTIWRDDEHETCGTPSLAVIPPPAIHTSQALEAGVNQLVDIFSPPRLDFSQKESWVLNAKDYPMP